MPNPWTYAAKTNSEFAEQAALFMWANMACRFGRYTADFPDAYDKAGWAKGYSEAAIAAGNDYLMPELEWLHAIKNQRDADNKIAGGKARAEGVKRGIPDIMLPVPMPRELPNPIHLSDLSCFAVYHGLYIELKRPKTFNQTEGILSEYQKNCLQYLEKVGYQTAVCYGWLEARAIILNYLGKA